MSAAALDLPPLHEAFGNALKDGGHDIPDTKVEPVKEPAAKEVTKEPVKEPVKKEVVKEKEGEKAKVETPAKKKSALDAAMSDEPVTEPSVDEVAKLIESKDPNWDKARETMKRQSEELKSFREKKPEIPADIQAQIAEAKTLKTTLEKIQQENAKLRDSLIAVDVRLDPAVQEKMQGRESKVNRLSSDIKEAGADAQSFIEAMAMPLNKRGKAIDAILENIESPRQRAVIERKLADIEVLDEQLDETLSKPHESFEQLKQRREVEAQQMQEQVEQFKQATFEKVSKELPKLSKLMRMAPADAEDAEAFNAQLKADLERAPSLLTVAPEEAALATYKAARYDSVEKMLIDKVTRISELEDALAKYEGASPGFRGGGKEAPKADYERPVVDVFREALSGGVS